MPSHPPTPDPRTVRPRVALICHHDAPLHSAGLTRWIASWADPVGVVVVHEPDGLRWKRLRRERRRVGFARLLDVMAFRAYYRLFLARRDETWKRGQLESLERRYASMGADLPTLHTPSPNSADAERFLRDARPDIVLALCKNILAERIFTIPTHGTFVCHPGICPEYRNAHGCFWALASDDLDRVGLTLLRIDRGIDTGPVLGYYSYPFDERRESHIVIQHRVLLDNLDALADTLRGVVTGTATPIPTAGRASHEWGQPWLSKYLRWKRRARRRAAARRVGVAAEA
ncbi:MAG TPA: formyltransferase family protein [Gemmatimonadaceae bacterium]|nr:formyltransferase family protein [Gemmatimonadaceae bacterium]